jgi:opine dehydrogenase
MIRHIAILGAGHGGCAAAADLTSRGFSVRLHSGNPERLAPLRAAGGIHVRGVHQGFVPLECLTTSVEEAVTGAGLIMLVVPSIAHETYAQLLAPLLRPGLPLFLNPGHTGGGLHFTHELRRAGYADAVRCCETVTLTYICRMEGPATVNIYSHTKNLAFAAFPGKHQTALYDLVKPLYPEIVPASSVLETALTNINAVFHPPGMIMNAGWIEHTGGDFLFYREGITEAVGRVTAAVDVERLAIARALGVPARSFLEAFFQAGLTTRAALESGDIARACKESGPNATIKSPPTLAHRYVHEDVGYGLVPIEALGALAGVRAPTIGGLIQLAGLAAGTDFRATGLNVEKLGMGGLPIAELAGFIEHGDIP